MPPRQDAAEIRLALRKLQVLASVLYVAAHPDDENTRLIAYLGKGRLADAAYLSMTRGDGGQNLIGPEIGDLLGIIRSQELLAARRIDGGRQFFTRAIDFGFSKSPEETLRIWDQDEVLSDTVRVFRQFQPDVVITRFPAGERTTHGHHTASARLARDAMTAAGDPKRFPAQLDRLAPWRPKRLLWNTSPWFYDKREDFNPAALLKLDVGGYSALLGESFTELAARSRSMHRSQGFGSSGTRGEVLEYLGHVDGERATSDIFEGIDTTWGRVPGGKSVGAILERANKEFDPENPARVVPVLLEARKKIQSLPAGRWKETKLGDLDRTIAACLGLYLEASAGSPWSVPGGKLKIELEAANRSPAAVRLVRVAVPAAGFEETWTQDLKAREAIKKPIEIVLPENLPDSQPYWLRDKGTLGMFRVDDPDLIGLPENRPTLGVRLALEVDGVPFDVERPVVHKWTDPVLGERYRPFEVLPAVSVEIAESVLIFPDADAREVAVTVRANRPAAEGSVRLEAPEGWTTLPALREFSIAGQDATTTLTFSVRPPSGDSVGALRAVAEVAGRRLQQGLVHVEHPHIPTQVVLPPAEAKVVRLSLRRRGRTIGYLQGAGDQVPAGLRRIGFDVTELADDDLTVERLRAFDAVILGVRAYNTRERIRFHQPALFDYAKSGGTVIVQYNTSHELNVEGPGPFPLTISRDRVSEETAEVRFLLPGHPVLNDPNRITAADFDGWVQERGLYFANSWDGAFQAVLSCNDAGEPPRDGGLLVAKHGDGYFVYTTYSWFRQIPAGVPGAYRLLANLIALGN
jgi:LmbE family N-acetylglucosaminyl deacetylase